MAKIGEPFQEISEGERDKKLKEAGTQTIHRKSDNYVRPAKDVRKLNEGLSKERTGQK